jgi:hypothetical protein
VLYRRTLNNQSQLYWTDPVTVEANASSPALIKVGSTLVLFYSKAVSSINQIFMRTSTNEGLTWSSAIQLTNETVSMYQVQACNVSGTVYLFWSLADDSCSLKYITSTNLTTWSTVATVGQVVGPLESFTNHGFYIKYLRSVTCA